jgi:hypothetical protein
MTWFLLIALLAVPPAGDPKEVYAATLKRVLADDPSVDYREFRIAGALASGPDEGKRQTFDRAAFRQKQQVGDNQGALEVATKALERNYASVVNHLDAMYAYQNLNDAEASAKHEKVLNAMLESIRNSGDGKGPDTAWFVVNTQEEYVFIARVLKLKAKAQALVEKEGHWFDRIEVVDPATGQSQFVFFNTDIDMHAYKPAP